MARHTYNCGGKGRYSRPKSGICTWCGRRHPRGKRAKALARSKGWLGCRAYAIQKKA